MKIISKVKYPNGKREILLFGKKVLSYKKKKKITKYDEIYARRFDGLTQEEIRYCLEVQFERMCGYKLNLDNPQTFNEKIQWLKLYYRNPLMTKCADKVGVREYIKEKIGEEYLVPIIGIYNSPDEIDFDSLPDKFVMKVNWGSGQNIIVTDKSKLDIKEAKEKLTNWMKRESNHYFSFFEWCYKDIEPKIIIEEFLDFDDNLIDYKIMCYNGKPKNLFTCSERNTDLKVTFFDLNWNKLPFNRKYPNSIESIEKPKFFDEMLKLSEKLAGDFPFVRIDFYCVKDRLYVGEMTFFPGAGHEKFNPVSWDYRLGDLLKLPAKKTSNPMIFNENTYINTRNIILIWPKANAFEALMRDPNVYIPVLVDNDAPKDLLNKYRHRIGRVYKMYPRDYETFFYMTETDYLLSQQDVEKYTKAQFKIERFMKRHLDDLSEVNYRYLHSLAFWLGIFDKYKIDCVISDRVEHGDLNDVVLYEIAKSNNIPCYILSIEYANMMSGAFSLVKLVDDTSEKLKLNIDGYPKINMSSYIFNKDCQNRTISNKEEQKNQKRTEKKIAKDVKKYTRKLKSLSGFDRYSFITSNYQSWDRPNPIQKWNDYKYTKLLSEMYDVISEDVVSDENFVFYALHFEPEATILNRTVFSNQLYNIKMLAKSLPKGWKLYVKEHPMQFAFTRKDLSYCFNNINYFRSLEFYAQIARIDNVRIIKKQVLSDYLVNLCKAVATINGTVSLEAVSSKKPLIIFSKDTCMMGLLKDTFIINKYDQIRSAMNKIEHGFLPKYDDLQEVFENYLYELKDFMSNNYDEEKIAFYSKLFGLVFNNVDSFNLHRKSFNGKNIV